MQRRTLTFTLLLLLTTSLTAQEGHLGFYRYPTMHNDLIVFAAEGDLWSISSEGGLAQRLTTHHGEEMHPRISPDGSTLAFSASYEGPTEVYTMPITGGLPTRQTYETEGSLVMNWTPDGHLLYSSRDYATLPDRQSIKLNTTTGERSIIPLSQATEMCSDHSSDRYFFVRPSFHGNVTKRYKGGTARMIWRYGEGDVEAVNLTAEYDGESHRPMFYNERVYFISDRDGIMNLWSMNAEGDDLTQHTHHENFDVKYASMHNGRIVYQMGADIWLYDISDDESSQIEIRIVSDLEQLREKWVEDPSDYITHVDIHPDGEGIVITARGRVFVAPHKSGRFVQIGREEGVRYRDAVYSADGTEIIYLSDASGEFEFISTKSNGLASGEPLTSDGDVLRFQAHPSPDGKYIAFSDLAQDLWLLHLETGEKVKISTNDEGIGSVSWAPDGTWLAFEQNATNTFSQIHLHEVSSGDQITLTSDRSNSFSPVWSPDGNWIYYLADRNFQSLVGSPWGARQPEAYLDRSIKLYQVALKKGLRSPFRSRDELATSTETSDTTFRIDRQAITQRIYELPVQPGNYRNLSINDDALYFTNRSTGLDASTDLMALKISNEDPKPQAIAEGIRSYQLAGKGKHILIVKGSTPYIIKAGTSKVSDLSDAQVDLSNWRFSIDPKEDWAQIFTDAWRMERDYFYDPNMHGVDWDGMYEKYAAFLDRVTTRQELSDLIGEFVGELSALHTSVRGGDLREGDDDIGIGDLGARLSKVDAGFKIDYIYQTDPEYPNERSPLADPYLDLETGDIITAVNGESALQVNQLSALLRNTAGKQVILDIQDVSEAESRQVIVTPLSSSYDLRYTDWEYTRRLAIDASSDEKIGYLHLRAMGSNDLMEWYRSFYPVFNRQGLIIDVRHNRGGNIESLLLEKLLRKAWFYWKSRSGVPYANMPYAFTGHMVVLVDRFTASDGEAFAEGFKRLGMGPVIGTRTWGGEIWLSGVNRLSDGGLARAPMMGVYSPEGEWLIEGHGVVPDIEVDNLPHETFKGRDAQLEKGIEYLLEKIAEDPREIPDPPAFPDKSFEK